MNDVQKSTIAAGGITLACLCFYAGSARRGAVDLGKPTNASADQAAILRTWVASRDNEDVNVPAVDYYGQMVTLLKRNFVEPIRDDQKLAAGSVRGMVASLADPRSVFMSQGEFHAFQNRKLGTYEGIGADLYLDLARPLRRADVPSQRGAEPPPEDAEEAVARLSRFPRVVVSAVVPGGPADKAGVKPGDVVSSIDGHWVVDEALLDKFRLEQRLFNERKITFSQIAPLQRELRKKTERALLPMRAQQRLLIGTSGVITVVWDRAGTLRTTNIAKSISKMPQFGVSQGVIRLPMTDAAIDDLKKAIATRRDVKIDLRNQPEGSFEAMRQCLSVLAAPGTYGYLKTQRAEQPEPLTVTSGNSRPPKLTLLVDSTTRGPAEILALALSSRGKASLVGSEMSSDRSVSQTVELPDGTGYDFVTATYVATVPKSSVVAIQEDR